MNLDDLRVDVKQLKDDLLPIETNAQSGIDLAKARYEDAKAIQEDAIKIHDNNSKLVDEAVRFNLEIEDKIADARSALHKFEDGQNHLQETSANVSLKLQTCSDWSIFGTKYRFENRAILSFVQFFGANFRFEIGPCSLIGPFLI